MKKLLISVVLLLACTNFVGAMDKALDEFALEHIPLFEAALQTPFAQILQTHGWTVELVPWKVHSQHSGKDSSSFITITISSPNPLWQDSFKMVQYRSPGYLRETWRSRNVVTFSAKVGLDKIYVESGKTAWDIVRYRGQDKNELKSGKDLKDFIRVLRTAIDDKSLVLTESEQLVWEKIMSLEQASAARTWTAACFGGGCWRGL